MVISTLSVGETSSGASFDELASCSVVQNLHSVVGEVTKYLELDRAFVVHHKARQKWRCENTGYASEQRIQIKGGDAQMFEKTQDPRHVEKVDAGQYIFALHDQ